MNKFMIFDDPAIAQVLREAGFAVFKQQYNGKECFATEKTAELLAFAPNIAQKFETSRLGFARTLHF